MRSEPPIDIFLTKCTDHIRINLPEMTVTLTPPEAFALAKKLRRMAAFIQLAIEARQ
jgi:hypothetical protein